MNLMAEVGRYLQGHGDNVGEEIELLHLEKIVAKLSSRIRFAQLSCAIYYHWA